jgi:hypothetical protein
LSRRTALPVAALLSLALVLSGCGGKKAATGPVRDPSQSQTQVQPTAPGVLGSAAPAAGSAGCPASNTKNFAKTRFLLHAGEGFGAFHRYLYKPFKAGLFAKGSKGRIKNFLKAGAAALFIKRQIRLASENVKANPTLCKLIAAPLAKVGDTISGVVTKLKGGDVSGIEQVNTSISSIESTSGGNGVAVAENANPNLNG